MQKDNNRDHFSHNSEEFISMTEEERIVKINKHPFLYKEELEKRRKAINESLEVKFDGYSKQNLTGIRVSSSGGHADITASMAIEREYFRGLLKDDVTLQDLICANDEKMPKMLKVYVLLKRAFLLYEKVIDLYEEDVREVMIARLNNATLEDVIDEVHLSRPAVCRRITKAYSEIKDKASEVADLYYY